MMSRLLLVIELCFYFINGQISLPCSGTQDFIDPCNTTSCSNIFAESNLFFNNIGMPSVRYRGPFANTAIATLPNGQTPTLTATFELDQCIRESQCRFQYKIYFICNPTQNDTLVTRINNIIEDSTMYSINFGEPDPIRDVPGFQFQCGDRFEIMTFANPRVTDIIVDVRNLQPNSTLTFQLDGTSFTRDGYWVLKDLVVFCEAAPTAEPTQTPTMATDMPTDTPTGTPTMTPTITPTMIPTQTPSITPSMNPTGTPTGTPTMIPTLETSTPTDIPSMSTNAPTDSTTAPTSPPTAAEAIVVPVTTEGPKPPILIITVISVTGGLICLCCIIFCIFCWYQDDCEPECVVGLEGLQEEYPLYIDPYESFYYPNKNNNNNEYGGLIDANNYDNNNNNQSNYETKTGE